MTPGALLSWPLRYAIDFALPPRCASCGAVVDEVGLFCPSCWPKVDWLAGGCQRCGLPLKGTEADTCAACLAEPGKLDRVRATVAYDERARSLVLRLKYGRKTALAKVMAGYMLRPLRELEGGALLVPVPLHRSRLWSRGFNQSALIAAALAKGSDHPCDPFLLERKRRTPKLKGMTVSDRKKAVKGRVCASRGQECLQPARDPGRRRLYQWQYRRGLCPAAQAQGGGERFAARLGSGGRSAARRLVPSQPQL
jgi:predicted amidophosphoribosyltransferase